MLIQAEMLRVPSVDRLLKAWARLYVLNLQTLPLEDPAFETKLVQASLPAGRVATAARLNERLIALKCEVASIQTNSFYSYMQSVMNLREVRQLAEVSLKVYKLLIDLYQHDSLGTAFSGWLALSPNARQTQAPIWSVPDILRLANLLEDVLQEFQRKHMHATDWRALGFMTTQINFCNRWFLLELTYPEQVLLNPYLKFVEEQIAHPWQRVCAAAARYPDDHLLVRLLERMIPRADEIAQASYNRLADLFPHHRSRQGLLTDPKVAHSCTRDLQMFQAYLWLSVLEQNTTAIEQELLSLCIRVVPSVNVKWSLTKRWVQVLTDELLNKLDPFEQEAVLPYLTQLHQIFMAARSQLEGIPGSQTAKL